MNITEYADVINCNIEITYHHNQGCRWSAKFDSTDVLKESMLRSVFGNGQTPTEALKNYVTQIQGETIVFNAMSDDQRREFKVPFNISV